MRENELSLDSVPIGKTATVKKLNTTGATNRRLRDLGIIEGTRIKCLLKSPSGDPRAYLIRGAVIALRSEVSSQIIIKE